MHANQYQVAADGAVEPALHSAISSPQTEIPRPVDPLRFRFPTDGPEMRMVEEFLGSGLPPPPMGERLSVMMEPKVEGAFPDIVAAYWDPQVSGAWVAERRALTKADIRLLHFLYVEGAVAQAIELQKRFPRRGLKKSIERLEAAAVINSMGAQIYLRPIDEIFALRRLVCIEAKVSSPARAMDQAVRSTWFASEVYLLLPSIPNDEAIKRIAGIHGIGMVLPGYSIENAPVPAVRGRLPRSYASWIFNEWVWRLADGPMTEGEHSTRN